MFENRLYARAMWIFVVLFLLAGYSSHLEYQRSLDPMFHVKFDSKPELSYDEASKIALYLDEQSDKLPDTKLEVSEEEMKKLLLEIIPNFQYEGAVDTVRPPVEFGFRFYPDGNRHNHVLGQSNCESFVINLRYANPYSTLYSDPDWMQTVIHEMVHVQQGYLCSDKRVTRENIENTAEIVSWEIMAAQVNRGNTIFLKPLIDSLKGRMMGVAWYTAMKEHRMKDYEELVLEVSNNPYDVARAKKAQRYWSTDTEGLEFVLKAYGKQPFERLIVALHSETYGIEGLALPKTTNYRYQPVDRVFKVDDLAYVLLHLEELIGR